MKVIVWQAARRVLCCLGTSRECLECCHTIEAVSQSRLTSCEECRGRSATPANNESPFRHTPLQHPTDGRPPIRLFIMLRAYTARSASALAFSSRVSRPAAIRCLATNERKPADAPETTDEEGEVLVSVFILICNTLITLKQYRLAEKAVRQVHRRHCSSRHEWCVPVWAAATHFNWSYATAYSLLLLGR